MNKLLSAALFQDENAGDARATDPSDEIDFFSDEKDIKAMELSQRAQRSLETKLF